VTSDELLRYFSWICRIAAALFLAALLLSGRASAAGRDTVVAVAEPVPAAQAEAREIYASSCVSCHGASGTGDGLAAAGLPAKPANFSDASWQSRTSDQQIERAIVGGGAAVGKSPLMPANPNLAAKPQVVAALQKVIRGFASESRR
jgi:mono/diheme cytochrome c family protein